MDQQMVKTVMRKRGELNLTNKELSNITGVSQWTLSALFKGKRTKIHKETERKLNNWLYSKL